MISRGLKESQVCLCLDAVQVEWKKIPELVFIRFCLIWCVCQDCWSFGYSHWCPLHITIAKIVEASLLWKIKRGKNTRGEMKPSLREMETVAKKQNTMSCNTNNYHHHVTDATTKKKRQAPHTKRKIVKCKLRHVNISPRRTNCNNSPRSMFAPIFDNMAATPISMSMCVTQQITHKKK